MLYPLTCLVGEAIAFLELSSPYLVIGMYVGAALLGIVLSEKIAGALFSVLDI